MKKKILSLFFVALLSFGQESGSELKMISEFSTKNTEIRDIPQFEGIEYLKLKFVGKELSNKSFHFTVKEIWDGKIIRESTVMNSKNIGYEGYQKSKRYNFHLESDF